MLTADGIKAKAREIGFDLAGVAPAERHPKLARLAEWIAAGHAGEMAYLAKSADERADPRAVLESARSVVSLAVVYNTAAPYSHTVDETDRAHVARYAWGEDYHDVLKGRLRQLVGWMADVAGKGFEAFSCVDNGPVQERVFAERAGLGWIGKNTCLINPSLGSWLFLAEVLVNVDLDADEPGVDQCGSCRRCLDACPTDAITEPYTVDATRCLSYLTIEARGTVDESLRGRLHGRLFGCDICQDVCPWNRQAATSDDPAWQPRPALEAPRLIDLCRLSDAAWSALIGDSAMRRAGLHRVRRSLAYAAAELPAADAADALDALAAQPSAAAEPVAGALEWARKAAAGRGC